MAEISQNAPMNVSIEKLSIVDKYFSLKKEQRINRMQFFVRNVIGVLFGMGFLWIMLLLGKLGGINFEHANMFFVTSIILIYIYCINACKRAHDFNHKGLGYNLVALIGPFVVGLFLLALINIPGIMLPSSDLVDLSIYIIQVITWGVLQFRKGNPGSNKYGPAPTGKPLV